MSSFFDFEIGPPSITYQDAADIKAKKSLHARPNANKNYYYYHSEGYPENVKPYPALMKKQVVTPGTHYKSSTEKTFIEGEEKVNESTPIFNQQVGGYQVSIVDANNPIFSKLGLSPEDLASITGYKKIVTNSSMVASDSTQSASYAENPRHNHPNSAYPPPNYHNSQPNSNQPSAPSHQPNYDASRYPPQANTYAERQYTPNDRYPSSETPNSHNHNHASASHHPPPQGSYDAKSYRAVQSGYPQSSNGYNYPPPNYDHHQHHSGNAYNNPHQSSASYNNPHQQSSYSNPNGAPYNYPPPHASPNPTAPSSSYNPQRISEVPWRPSTQQHHTDWDDKKKESWQSGSYPPHPPPLPYSSTSSNSGSYYQKTYYGPSSDKTSHHPVATYKPESSSKPIASSSAEYGSHKPYYSPSTYSSSSKVPSRAGSVSIAASSHAHAAPAKPGITIRFKANSPHQSGVSIPLSLSPFEVVKKFLPALNPLNNKKVTIGITIENKKEHQPEYHSY